MSSNDSDIWTLVSVIVPVYNSERYLSRCLDSILGQTYPNVEVVAIDDGSSDGSASMLDDYAVRFPNKVIVEHRQNGGVATARNRAIELARGDYLTFADNDDFLDSDCIALLVEAALRDDADVVCSGYRRPDAEGRIRAESIPLSADDWSVYVIGAAWGKLYRTSYVRQQGFAFLSTNIGEDLHFTLPAVHCATTIAVVPRAVYNWYYNLESVSSTAHRTSAGLKFEATLDALVSVLDSKGLGGTETAVHYIVRLIAWYLFYTRSGDGYSISRQNVRKYTTWLNNRWVAWRQDPLASPFTPFGDAASSRIASWLFTRHPRIFDVVLWAYGMIAR